MEEYSGEDVDPDRVQEAVENELLTEKIIDWLLERSSIELVPEGSLNPPEADDATEESVESTETEESDSGSSESEEQTVSSTPEE